ncbi:MAG: hypothetical protein WBP79_09085 [Candidatus Acidiferrales bacterium]
MKRIGRREFNRLAVAGAAIAPLAGLPTFQAALPQSESRPSPKWALTPEQAEKVKEAWGKRNEQLKGLRDHTLQYGLEPAFIFRVRSVPRRGQLKG